MGKKARRRWLSAGFLIWVAAAEPTSNEVPTPEDALGADRDALIAKIARGQDVAGSLRSFSRLLERREQLLKQAAAAAERKLREEAAKQAAAEAALEAEKRAEAERLQKEAMAAAAERQREAEKHAYLSSLDHNVGKYCHLSVDPRQRHFKGGVSADWGRVTRKVEVRIPGKRPLDDERVLNLYEIAGAANTHVVRGDYGPHLKLEVGDLIFLCGGPANTDRELPPPWNRERLTSPGYGGRLALPPRIAKKGQWNPIHITHTDLWHAISNQEWPFPAERYVLCNIQIGEQRPDGRFESNADDPEKSFLLEVPKALPKKELLKPGEWRWVIMGNQRFDRQLKSLVLVVADIEERYLIEK